MLRGAVHAALSPLLRRYAFPRLAKIPANQYVFDAHTQQPVHAFGETVDDTPVEREGIEFKWPFLTEKRDYEYLDAQARASAPIHYKGPRPAPESIARTGTTLRYTAVRRFWVEPLTGAPVYGEELHNEELRGGTPLGGRGRTNPNPSPPEPRAGVPGRLGARRVLARRPRADEPEPVTA